MYFKQFFDDKLAQYAYLIGCQANGKAIVLDPMRDVDIYMDAAAKEGLTLVGAVDTHIHADYISGLRELADRGVTVYASDEGDSDWKYEWLKGSEYTYKLLKDGDTLSVGNIKIQAWHTPGHTPEHLSYLVTDGAASDKPLGVITGDFVFVGDVGRPDLLESAAGQANVMEPSARTLFKSVERFRELPDHLQIWPGHGSGSACGKALGAVPMSTVGYEWSVNQSLKAATSEDAFVEFILDGQPEPPLYFARMKRDNKTGPSLAAMARPERWSAERVAGWVSESKDNVILDTRDKESYAAGHLPGSILSPMNRQFNTIAGSYITEDQQIVLLVEEHLLEEATRDLYRIGLDHVIGYMTPRDLQHHVDYGGELETLHRVGFDAIRSGEVDGFILDVRKATEYADSHLEGALNIAHTRLLPNLEKVPTDQPVLVHCQTGGRSAVASALLQREGVHVTFIDDNYEAASNVTA
ncbi:MAG: MBL fold metallo-hydrolase [Balneolaceae bacterium]